MANSGSFNTTAYEGRYLKFSWEVKSQSNNSSTISWKLVGAGTGQSGYYTSGNFKVVINGKTVYSSSTRINLYNGTEVASGTATIAHNSDGTKTFSASAEAGIYYVAVNCKGSGSWSLPAIASTPTITNAPNLTNLMSSFKVSFSNPSKSALTVKVGLDKGSYVSVLASGTSSSTSYTFTMTPAMKSSLTSAAGNYIGGSTPIIFSVEDAKGNEATVNRTFTILDDGTGGGGGGGGGGVTYDVSFNPTVIDNNSTTTALTGNSNILVKYHSNARFTVGASTTSGVVIEESWQSCSNSGQTAIGSTGTITGVWSNEFTFSVISSFIGSHSTTLTKTMIEYVKPTCSVYPGNPDTNGNVIINISGDYFNGSFGAKNNTLTLKYRYKSSTSSSYSSWITITPTITGNRYSASATITGLNYQSTYTIEAQATDLLETATGSSLDVKAKPVFSWSGDDFEFDVPVYADKIVLGNYNPYGLGIYGTTSGGSEISQFVPCGTYNVCEIGKGGYDSGIGGTYIYGQDILGMSNSDVGFMAGSSGEMISIGTDGTSMLTGDTVYLGNGVNTTAIMGGGYNIIGAIRAMSTSYQLSPYVVSGANYSSTTVSAYLLGNTLAGNLNCTRSSSTGSGDIANETVCTVQIPHGGKIQTAYAATFTTGRTGHVAAFTIYNLSITSTHINFDIQLTATAGAEDSFTSYFQIPIVINPSAY